MFVSELEKDRYWSGCLEKNKGYNNDSLVNQNSRLDQAIKIDRLTKTKKNQAYIVMIYAFNNSY